MRQKNQLDAIMQTQYCSVLKNVLTFHLHSQFLTQADYLQAPFFRIRLVSLLLVDLVWLSGPHLCLSGQGASDWVCQENPGQNNPL